MTIGKTRIVVTVLLLASSHLFTLSSGNASETLANNVARVLNLEEHCKSVSEPPHVMDDSCFQELDEHFNTQPIWHAAWVTAMVRHKAHSAVLNDRVLSNFYIDADFVGKVPQWQDVFDGRIEERLGIVRKVFSDETCNGLARRGAIKSTHAARCQSRELFKYAAYLDACMTVFSRLAWFHVVGTDGLTWYGRSDREWIPL